MGKDNEKLSLISGDINEVDGEEETKSKNSKDSKLSKIFSKNDNNNKPDIKQLTKNLLKLDNELNKAKEEKEKLKEDLMKEKELKSKANAKARKIKQEKEELEEKLNQVEVASTTLDSPKTEEIHRLEKELALSEEEVINMKDIIARMNVEQETYQKTVDNLYNDIEKLSLELGKAKEEDNEMSKLASTLFEHESQLEIRDTKIKELQATVNMLNDENEKATESLRSLEKEKESLVSEETVTVYKEEINDLKEQLKVANEKHNEELEYLDVQLKAVTESRDRTLKNLAGVEVELERVVGSVEKRNQELQEETEKNQGLAEQVIKLNEEINLLKGNEVILLNDIETKKAKISEALKLMKENEVMLVNLQKSVLEYGFFEMPEELRTKFKTDYPQLFVTVNEMLIYSKEKGFYEDFVNFIRSKSEVFTKANWDSFKAYNGK